MYWPMHQQRVLQLPTSKPSKHELEFATPEPTSKIKSLSAFRTYYKRQVLGWRYYSKEHLKKDRWRADFRALYGGRTQYLCGMTYDSEVKPSFTRVPPIHQQIIDIPISLFYSRSFEHKLWRIFLFEIESQQNAMFLIPLNFIYRLWIR